MVSIDKVFCNHEWEARFPEFMLMAASTSCSDHCPLVLASVAAPRTPPRFRFENFWPRFPRFQETVTAAWNRPVNHSCPWVRMATKLRRSAADLKIWANTLFSDAKLQFHLASEVILQLDITQEKRGLMPSEFALRKMLKQRIVGLAAIERARKRQASRVTWLRAGDTKTAFFQAKINGRHRKNFIHALSSGDGGSTVTTHEDKADMIHQHFTQLLGRGRARGQTINWDSLELPQIQTDGLDNPFSEEEVWAAIKASPAEKPPGPEGFSDTFCRACWGTIKTDVMAVFDHFYSLARGNFSDLNPR